MKVREIIVVFLLLFVVLGGLSIPLWWDMAQPYIFGLPGYIEGVTRDIKEFIDFVLGSIK